MDSTMDSTMDSRPQTNRRNAHLATEPIRSNFGEVLKVDQLAGCKTLTDNPKVFVLQTNACGEVHESAGWQPHASNHTQPHATPHMEPGSYAPLSSTEGPCMLGLLWTVGTNSSKACHGMTAVDW